MIGLFFEVEPRAGHEDRYFEAAADLRPVLDRNGGILFIDRYKSLDTDGKILSYQHWQDEAYLLKWRNNEKHQTAQRAGREVHFSDYRIRVATQVTADTALAAEASRWLVAIEGTSEEVAALEYECETFSSVYRDNQFVSLFDAATGAEALAILEASDSISDITDINVFSVIRDYTMTDRTEAPQDW